jgi:tRNA C32,U32 (ribose-2'-O)-methylase TrmJ
MSDDKVRQFPGTELPENLMAIAPRQPGFCQHEKVTLDEHIRTVSCAKCGATIDAFSFLMHNAKTIQMAWQHHRMAMHKVQEITERVDVLKREENRLRGIVKRLQVKSSAVLDVRGESRF